MHELGDSGHVTSCTALRTLKGSTLWKKKKSAHDPLSPAAVIFHKIKRFVKIPFDTPCDVTKSRTLLHVGGVSGQTWATISPPDDTEKKNKGKSSFGACYLLEFYFLLLRASKRHSISPTKSRCALTSRLRIPLTLCTVRPPIDGHICICVPNTGSKTRHRVIKTTWEKTKTLAYSFCFLMEDSCLQVLSCFSLSPIHSANRRTNRNTYTEPKKKKKQIRKPNFASVASHLIFYLSSTGSRCHQSGQPVAAILMRINTAKGGKFKVFRWRTEREILLWH